MSASHMPVIAGQAVLFFYAFFLAVGGVIGFRRAGSKASLIAGIVSANLESVAIALTFFMPKAGLMLGGGVAAVLVVVFTFRFLATRRIMPSAMLAIISLVVAIIVLGQAASLDSK